MNSTIQVRIKSVYGNDLIYPVCNKAINLSRLTGAKTFTQNSMKIIEELGYTIQYIT